MNALEVGSDARIRIAVSVMLGMTAWPFVHFGLASRYEVNPWKLGGMAMYCTTHKVTLHFEYRGGGDPVPRPLFIESLPPELQAGMREHYEWRVTLGRLYSLEPLAREVLTARPDIEELILAVGVTRLDRATGEHRTTTRSYRYRRR